MKKILLIIFLSIIIIGCSSNKYGYTPEEWNNLTQQKRLEIKTKAEQNLQAMMEKAREREFLNRHLNKPKDERPGPRSNVYYEGRLY